MISGGLKVTLMGLSFAGVKFRGSSHSGNLEISRGFRFSFRFLADFTAGELFFTSLEKTFFFPIKGKSNKINTVNIRHKEIRRIFHYNSCNIFLSIQK